VQTTTTTAPERTVTMSSIDSLLNHEAAASAQRRPSMSQQHFTQTTTYEAADALTTLATLGSGQQYAPAPARELPSPTAFNAPRRSSSFGSHHAPVEPSPPLEQPALRSPTLDQYHHGSQSPEEQKRRQSLMSTSPAPVLAPIQNLSAALQEQIADKQPMPAPLGEEVSQIVPPSSRSSEGGEADRDSTQDREPAFVRNEPTTSQIRKPESPAPALSHVEPSLPSDASPPSPRDAIKDEPSGTPRESTPAAAASQPERQNSIAADNMDSDALKALEIAKQADLGLRTKRTASVADNISSPVDSKPPPLPSKKRSAPSSASTMKKKGTAKAMKPSKKRKLDPEDASARSVTPTSRAKPSKGGKKGSQAGTPGLESSPAPDNSSQVHASDDDGESSEDHNLYCICKKPDNHRWMIGCDGGCDDWFHGDCINMKQADEELVDKFICPQCEENGRGHTTWKPMCRRDGCRKPARLAKDRESKYCSDACGTLFMTEQLQRTAGAKGANGTKDKSKKAKKKGGKNEEEGEEEEPTPLGGVLRAKDLKALVDASPNIQAFKNLGTGVLTPPQTASPNRISFDGADGFAFTAGETERLNALHNEKSQLNDRLEVLKDREKFVSMAKEQAVRVAEREKIKMKEFCGYDSRLSWSDAEFLQWRNGKHGRAAFKFSTLSPTAEQISSMPAVNGSDISVEAKESVCLKKRCPKHPQWQKLNLQDARFEELEVVEAIRECEKEEKSVRERARRRGAKDAMARELTAGEGSKEERNREGWVEVVAS
jgi:COMPASS component SPP1